MNFLISLMMGVAFSYLADALYFETNGKPPADYITVIAGGFGALLSYNGFEFLLDRVEKLFDRIIEIFIKRYEK